MVAWIGAVEVSAAPGRFLLWRNAVDGGGELSREQALGVTLPFVVGLDRDVRFGLGPR